jgi:hypothetical protein
VNVEDLWNPYKKEQPRFRRPKTYHAIGAILLMIAVGMIASKMVLRPQQPTVRLASPDASPKESLPIRAYDMGPYVVENARAVWKREDKKYETADPVDQYEVTGQIRRKNSNAPSHLTLKVEMRVGIVRVNVTQKPISGVEVSRPTPFTVPIEDATHARLRKADLNFVISALLSSSGDDD